MDEEYIDPAVLKARATAKGHRADDVTVGRRPVVRRPQATSDVSDSAGITMTTPVRVSIRDAAVINRGLAATAEKTVLKN